MATTAAVVIAGEVAKVLLNLYFQYVKQSGLNAEEAEKLYLQTRLDFIKNDPALIPTV
jgi:hypothetical protein